MATTRKSKATPRQLAALKKARAAKVKNTRSINGVRNKKKNKAQRLADIESIYLSHFAWRRGVSLWLIEKYEKLTIQELQTEVQKEKKRMKEYKKKFPGKEIFVRSSQEMIKMLNEIIRYKKQLL